MTATIIDGKAVSNQILEELKAEVDLLREKGQQPGLAVILVGDDPASQVYVRNKERACKKLGIFSSKYCLPDTTPEEELIQLIQKLNRDPNIHGILLQLPLPQAIDEKKVLDYISPNKDVDGFHPYNLGRLLAGDPIFLPCTPQGVQELLVRYQIPIEGQNVVIVGRSNIVGKPLAMMLVQKAKAANATVSLCHTRTKNLKEFTSRADILIVACGKARMVTADLVRPGAAVIDVGINRIDGKLVGDVDFEQVSQISSFITPVPGGVGPMTIAMLMKNTIKAAKRFWEGEATSFSF
ncbi:MAG: methylenetetrahydrofolate dehydrogenase / methenyltetrahydrofolate cyclohydrolase [Candidatus Atribacteria bacterium]|nr:methylenetetrahydrofolate dehydrogenase / methenyltetrahydrofolate cyclohydrolase [Candidatus Atribacteria bacterium]